MTPQEKARELVSKMDIAIPEYPDYLDVLDIDVHVAAAIVVADEMIKHVDVDGIGYYGRFWKEVKAILENMSFDTKSGDDIFHEGLIEL
jgi:hypothetical protein